MSPPTNDHLRSMTCAARRSAAVTVLLLAAPLSAGSDVTFSDVTTARGFLTYDSGTGYGAGVSVADYDDDGDLDVFVPNGRGVADQLYRNDGTGHFEEIAAAVGLADTRASRTALFIDLNGDARLDLVVAGDCFVDGDGCLDEAHLRAYQQLADGTFVESAWFDGIDDRITGAGQHRAGLVAGDLNGDGVPDLVTGLWTGHASVLMSDGAGGFVDRAPELGIAGAATHHWQPAIHDFNRDGHADLYWAIDFSPNRLWMNNGDGTFTDRAPKFGVDNSMNDMGLALGDYDDDGDFDFYITEIFVNDNHNVLYRNDTVDGAMAFMDVSEALGVDSAGFAWGTTFLDVDLDGDLDLGVTNGWFNGVGFDDPTRLFVNQKVENGAAPTFVDRAPEFGIADTDWGACLVAFDMDRDGDLDLLQTCNQGPIRLLENQRSGLASVRRFLTVRPRMDGANPRAIGATVRVTVGDTTMSRRITAGTSHLGQEPAEAHFGLGFDVLVDRVVVEWPDGARSDRRNVLSNQVLDLRRSPCAGTGDLDGNGAIDFNDLLWTLGAWGPCAIACPEDVDGDGSVTFDDVAMLIAQWGECE